MRYRNPDYSLFKLHKTHSCPKKLFMCKKYEYCINIFHVNDNQTDCDDNSDETKNYLTESKLFHCQNSSEKILVSFVCNFIKDCADGSDENLCGKLLN